MGEERERENGKRDDGSGAAYATATTRESFPLLSSVYIHNGRERLIEKWCDRIEYRFVDGIWPAYRTDGEKSRASDPSRREIRIGKRAWPRLAGIYSDLGVLSGAARAKGSSPIK